MNNLYRGPSIDASYQVSVHLAKRFQGRRLKCEKLTDDGRQVMAKLTLPLARRAKNWQISEILLKVVLNTLDLVQTLVKSIQTLTILPCIFHIELQFFKGPSWSYGSWSYNYLCNQCLSPLTWVRILFMLGILDITLCDKVCQWLATGLWFSPDTITQPPVYH
jgi:hypothetical protein